jgi:ATP/maltotriose-dependent transcriptional regulator MalT
LLQTLSGDEMVEAAREAVELLEGTGDRRNLAAVHLHLAYKHCRSRSFVASYHSVQQALEHIDGANWRHSITFATYLNIRALLHAADGSFDRAREAIADAESLARSLGDEHFITMWCQYLRAETEFGAGNIRSAVEIAERMLHSEHALVADRVAFHALSCLATFYLALGDADASRVAARNLLLRARSNDPRKVALAIGHLAAFAAHRGELRLAARLKGFIDSSSAHGDCTRTPG